MWTHKRSQSKGREGGVEYRLLSWHCLFTESGDHTGRCQNLNAFFSIHKLIYAFILVVLCDVLRIISLIRPRTASWWKETGHSPETSRQSAGSYRNLSCDREANKQLHLRRAGCGELYRGWIQTYNIGSAARSAEKVWTHVNTHA